MAKCSGCSKTSIYFRRNEGRHYCKFCFSKNIEKRVKNTIGRNKLIAPGDKVAIAYSGGKDSANVLFILSKMFEDNPKIDVVAITIDEGHFLFRKQTLKGIESFCKKLGMEYHVIPIEDHFGINTEQITKKAGEAALGYCATLRRYLLNKRARELGVTKLATGHNLDDECQTLLMNVLRSDVMSLARMGPMPKIADNPKFVPRIKPLIKIPENESKLYAQVNDIPFYPSDCPRAGKDPLRRDVKKFLDELDKRSPGIMYNLLKTSQALMPLIVKDFKTGKINVCESCGEPSSSSVCRACQVLGELEGGKRTGR